MKKCVMFDHDFLGCIEYEKINREKFNDFNQRRLVELRKLEISKALKHNSRSSNRADVSWSLDPPDSRKQYQESIL